MEFFRAGEALIRSSQPLLLPFLHPSTYRTPSRTGAISKIPGSQQWQRRYDCRAFSSSHKRSHPASAAAARIDESGETIRRQQEKDIKDDIYSILRKDLDNQPSAFPTTQPSDYSSNATSGGTNPINYQRSNQGMNSIHQLVNDLSPQRDARSPQPRTNTSSQASGGNMDKYFKSIMDSADSLDMERAPSAKAAASTNDPAPLKLDSTTGRVIHVSQDRRIDAARAFALLGMRLARNNVRRDAQRQRFYERPGLKRKRLKSERWRKRFKEAFQGTVSRVVGLKRQGW